MTSPTQMRNLMESLHDQYIIRVKNYDRGGYAINNAIEEWIEAEGHEYNADFNYNQNDIIKIYVDDASASHSLEAFLSRHKRFRRNKSYEIG